MVWGITMVFVFLLVTMMVVMVEIMTEEEAPTASSDPAQSVLATDADLDGSSTKELGLPKAA